MKVLLNAILSGLGDEVGRGVARAGMAAVRAGVEAEAERERVEAERLRVEAERLRVRQARLRARRAVALTLLVASSVALVLGLGAALGRIEWALGALLVLALLVGAGVLAWPHLSRRLAEAREARRIERTLAEIERS